jgi:hypothetical protein
VSWRSIFLCHVSLDTLFVTIVVIVIIGNGIETIVRGKDWMRWGRWRRGFRGSGGGGGCLVAGGASFFFSVTTPA